MNFWASQILESRSAYLVPPTRPPGPTKETFVDHPPPHPHGCQSESVCCFSGLLLVCVNYSGCLFVMTIFPIVSLFSGSDYLLKGGDEVNELNILKMMSEPCYILACYECVFDKYLKNIIKNDVGQVQYVSGVARRLYQYVSHLQRQVSHYCTCSSEHHCPDNPNFIPSMECDNHLECNDPIFRCFYLADLATQRAYYTPEYSAEYEEISKHCCQLSVQLLEQCTSSDELDILFKESGGANKFFEYTDEMMYPRLRMAMELNLKEFIGHMFSQQMLRKKWHGVQEEWQGKTFSGKIIHCLMLILLAPICALIFVFVEIKKSLHTMSNPTEPFKDEEVLTEKLNWLRKIINVPLNRLIIFTGYYLIYVGIILLTISHQNDEIQHPYEHEFRPGYLLLSIYTISFIWDDFNIFIQLKCRITHMLKFWRIFDLLLHLLLGFTLICKLIRTNFFAFKDLVECACNGFVKNATGHCETFKTFLNCNGSFNGSETLFHLEFTDKNMSCIKDDVCLSDKTIRQNFHAVETISLAIVATLSMFRLIYWLQLSKRIGPLVLNISRVFTDIITVVASYVIIVIAFTSGLSFVLPTQSFHNILVLLIWSILDPGDKDKDLEIENNNYPKVNVSRILIWLYQIMIVIVLVPLLMVFMNSTVQKYHDQQQLYWKFIRTSIWIEYFDHLSGIPSPFSILNLFTYAFHKSILCFISLKKKCWYGLMENGILLDGDQHNSNLFDDRKRHAKLMLKLIQKYNGKQRLIRKLPPRPKLYYK